MLFWGHNQAKQSEFNQDEQSNEGLNGIKPTKPPSKTPEKAELEGGFFVLFRKNSLEKMSGFQKVP